MTALSTLFDAVTPVVPGVAAPTVLRHAQRTAVDFYRRSLAWRIDDLVSTSSGVATYTPPLTAVGDATVVPEKLLIASYDGTPLVVAAISGFRRARPDWKTATGTPTWALLDGTGDVRLSPIPSAIADVDLWLAVRPTAKTLDIPDDLFERHEPALLEGTLFRVLSEAAKEYTNPELAALHREEYERRLRAARVRAAGRRNRAPPEVSA